MKRLKGLEPSTLRMGRRRDRASDPSPGDTGRWLRRTDDPPGAPGADDSRAANGPIRRRGWRAIAIRESDRPGGPGADDAYGDDLMARPRLRLV